MKQGVKLRRAFQAHQHVHFGKATVQHLYKPGLLVDCLPPTRRARLKKRDVIVVGVSVNKIDFEGSSRDGRLVFLLRAGRPWGRSRSPRVYSIGPPIGNSQIRTKSSAIS